MFTFRRNYFWLTLVLLFIEIAIAIFVHDEFIRPYAGDIIAAILVYCFIRAFFKFTVGDAVSGALFFSVLIEALQSINIVQKLGLEDSIIARTALGHHFDWKDLLMYLIGILIAVAVERVFNAKKLQHTNH